MVAILKSPALTKIARWKINTLVYDPCHSQKRLERDPNDWAHRSPF